MIPVTESIKVSDLWTSPTSPRRSYAPGGHFRRRDRVWRARGNIFTSANSRKLHDFLLGGTATDDRDPAPVRLTPQITVSNVARMLPMTNCLPLDRPRPLLSALRMHPETSEQPRQMCLSPQ